MYIIYRQKQPFRPNYFAHILVESAAGGQNFDFYFVLYRRLLIPVGEFLSKILHPYYFKLSLRERKKKIF